MIYFDTFTKMHKNVGDLGKLIVAKGFKKLPKVQKIAQSGHTGSDFYYELMFFSIFGFSSANSI